MNNPALIALLQNAALLLAMVVVFDLAAGRQRTDGRARRQIIVGLVLGGLAMALIATAFHLESGIVFDTRSVLLSVSGLFFGAVPTVIAMAVAAAFRLFKGGAGAWTGTAVTLATGFIGILWRRFRKGRLQDISARELYAFGIVVHLVMLALMLTLPWDRATHVLHDISLPVLLVYPVAATALGLLLANRLRREQAAADLVASEARFRTLFESSGVVMLVIDPDSGRIVEANRAAAEFYGYSCVQLAAMNIAEINQLPPERMAAERQRAKRTDRNYFVFPHRLANGNVRTVEVHSHPIVREGQTLLFSIVFDVTPRMQAEAASRESEARLRLLIEHAPAALAMFDRDMRYLAVSRRWLADYGLEGQELIGRSHYEVFPEIGEQIKQDHLRGLAGEVLRCDEDRLVRANGTVQYLRWEMHPWRDGRGEIGGIVIFTEDVTQQKQAERALRESEERFRTLVDSAPEGIFVQAENRFLFVNPALARMLGAEKPEELVGADLMDRMAPEFHEAIRARIRHQRETGNLASPMEQDYLRLDGTRVPVETTAVPVRYAGRDAHLVFVRDVAERRRIEQEKQNLQTQLAQAQKMDSIGRLAGGVAHDFNNMLSVILGHAEMILETVATDQPLYSDLQEIRKAAERSADLTRQLLAFARKQTAAPKELDLNATVEGMLNMLRRLIGENVKLAWQPAPRPVPVRMDPSQLDQILANLCVNARDAVGETGTITIATGTADFDDAYCAAHPGYVPGAYAALGVSDDGCGMDTETLARLFEPFFTTKEAGKGTGLGLATVYGIVKQNRGLIHAYSEPGKGTTLQIHLPLQAVSGKQKPQPEPAAPLPRGRETILLVEDEPGILSMTRMMLELYGYHVLTAATPGEAFRQAETFPGEIHLLMTDVVMPEMNGRELARQLLARQPHLKRLFMSGYPADVIAHHGVLEPGVNFIQKPFSTKVLAAKVREALGDPSGQAPP